MNWITANIAIGMLQGAALGPHPAAPGIHRRGVFHPNDVGAQEGQAAGRHGTGPGQGEVENADALQGRAIGGGLGLISSYRIEKKELLDKPERSDL